MTITRHCSECQGDSSGKNRETLPPRGSHLVISSPLTRCLVSVVSVMLRTEKREEGMGMESSFQYRRQRHLTYKVTFERRLERSEDASLGIVERHPGSRGKQWRFWSERARSGSRIGTGTGWAWWPADFPSQDPHLYLRPGRHLEWLFPVLCASWWIPFSSVGQKLIPRLQWELWDGVCRLSL